MRAGRDVVLSSTTEHDGQNDNHQSYWSRAVSGVARVEAERLEVTAKRDITLTAAQMVAREKARLSAGRDLTLGTVTEGQGQSAVYGAKNRMAVSTEAEVGTTIAAEQTLTLVAGQDVHSRASTVTAGGALAVEAGRDIHLTAGQASGSAYDELAYKTRGFLSSKKTHTVHAVAWTQTQPSTLTGETVVLTAGRDLNVAGSHVGAQQDVTLSAQEEVAIVSGTHTLDGRHYEEIKKSGFGALGGISYGQRTQTDRGQRQQTQAAPSTVGSVEGHVRIHAGEGLAVVGSRVLAPDGDVALTGKQVTMDAARNTLQEKESHAIDQSGLTVTGSTPVINALQVGQRMGQAVGQLGGPADNAVMTALAGASTGLAAKNSYDAVRGDPAHLGGASVVVSVGSSESRSDTERASSEVQGSTVAAGEDLTVVARGAGQASAITVTGSTLSAGQTISLQAEGDLLLQAAQNVAKEHTKSQSSSASIGVGVSLGKSTGLTAELGTSAARSKSDGQDASWTNSHVTAGKALVLNAGGDMTFKGAQGQGEQIVAAVGGDLRMQSLQDSRTYHAREESAGLGASLCLAPFCYGSSSVVGNVGRGRMQSDFKSVTEPSGLWAGDGGFEIDVGGHTRLVGAAVASNDLALADGRNRLSTGTLETRDIKNQANYQASQVALGAGYSGGGQASDLGTTQDGQVAGGATKQHGTSVPTLSNGLGVGPPLVAAASGEARSTMLRAE